MKAQVVAWKGENASIIVEGRRGKLKSEEVYWKVEIESKEDLRPYIKGKGKTSRSWYLRLGYGIERQSINGHL